MNSLKLFTYLAFSLTPLMLIYYVKKKYKQKVPVLDDTFEYKVMFFSFNNAQCKQHIYSNVQCSNSCSLNDLLFIANYIGSAKYTVSMCMYLLTCTEIQNTLIQLHNRGIEVRFITDIVMAENPASKIMHLKEQGLKLKVQPSGRDNLLHHKFCLIDENHPKDSKIFFGTLNLTLQGMTSNFDAIIFTNNVQIVQKYRDEFEFLWSSFKSV